MPSLHKFVTAQLEILEKRHLKRTLKETACGQGMTVTQDGRQYISFAGNDYLGLSHHPKVIAAGQAALEKYGAGAGASRLVTGNHPLYAPLEAKLAVMKRKEAALVFGSGYLTNLGVIPALVGKGDLILADKLVHACIIDGAQLSEATLKRFSHNDMAHLESLLGEHRRSHKNALIVVDHVYSMDGDRAPLTELSALARKHDAWLMVDDAHGTGIPHRCEADIWMGTLSKAVGAYGGYVAANKSVIDYLITSARSFVFSTGLPPSVCASALAALEIMQAEPQRCARPLQLAQRVTSALGLPEAQSTIVPIILGSEETALAAAEALKKHGILAVAIRPPTVPMGSARLRLTFSASHTDAQIDQLIAALKTENIVPL